MRTTRKKVFKPWKEMIALFESLVCKHCLADKTQGHLVCTGTANHSFDELYKAAVRFSKTK